MDKSEEKQSQSQEKMNKLTEKIKEGKIIDLKEFPRKELLLYNGPHGASLVHLCCRYNNFQMLEKLLGQGCLFNVFDYRGATPLYYCGSFDSKDCADILMGYFADPRQRSAFSGKRVTELPSSFQEHVNVLTQHFELLMKDARFLFAYRIHEHFSYCFRQLSMGEDRVFIQGLRLHPIARNFFQEDPEKLADICIESYVRMRKMIAVDLNNRMNGKSDPLEDQKSCLVCRSKENLTVCDKCLEVSVCYECQNDRICMEIHQNNCTKKEAPDGFDQIFASLAEELGMEIHTIKV